MRGFLLLTRRSDTRLHAQLKFTAPLFCHLTGLNPPKVGGCQSRPDLVKMCICTSWFCPPPIHPPPSYLLHVSSAWIWIIQSCSPQGAFRFHVYMDLCVPQKRETLRKYPSVCFSLLTFDHHYQWCGSSEYSALLVCFTSFVSQFPHCHRGHFARNLRTFRGSV